MPRTCAQSLVLLIAVVGACSARAAEKTDLWSLKPIASVAVPQLGDEWVRNSVDAFVLAKLHEKGLKPSAEADRRTLIRRLSFDLLGLPPTPEEVDAFVADGRPDAYERLVDRMLASPRYGERWARYWLDVVHYGDTHGYDKDKPRPNAWPYRDYVIRAFNEDKPYVRFVEEQIAGDKLYPGAADGVVALGFLAAGPWDYVGHVELREGTLDKTITRNLDRDDMVSVTMNTFVSLTAQCARCHNHKFDPITQEDYYSLQACFAAVDRADRPYAPGKMVYAAASEFTPLAQFTPTHGKPRAVFLLKRGSEKSPVREVGPGTVECVTGLKARFDAGADEAERRADLARWIVDAKNPLTWRSIVNRIWQGHFGHGIVDTPSDFGHMGATPTHPELLDWLAADFHDHGQSTKRLHRLIVTSSTYRQSSAGNAEAEKIDAGNQFLWHVERRKLDAESVRDAILSVAGQLDTTMGGAGFRTFGFQNDESPRYDYGAFDPDDVATHRRSIYRQIVRSVPDPFMEALDCADPSQSVPRRNETLTALQALALLNDRFTLRMAEHLADRAQGVAGDVDHQVAAAFRMALGRAPTSEEIGTLVKVAREHGLANACRVIFNANEFVFVD